MGDVAEMMLDGTFCESCGAVFDDIVGGADPPGHPRSCDDCKPRAPKTNGDRRDKAGAT